MQQSVDAQTLLKEQLNAEREQVDDYLQDIQKNGGSISDRRSIIKSKDLLARQAERLRQVNGANWPYSRFLLGQVTPHDRNQHWFW